jgi:hypothetical protein
MSTTDLEKLNNCLDSLTGLQVIIEIISDELKKLQRESEYHELMFDRKGNFFGMTYRNQREEVFPVEHEQCFEAKSYCEWLPKHIASLREEFLKADVALIDLSRSSTLTDKLDGLIGKPWTAHVRLSCVNKILKWPGEIHPQNSWASVKVFGNVSDLLEKADKHDPHPTWAEYARLLAEFKEQIHAISDVVR